MGGGSIANYAGCVRTALLLGVSILSPLVGAQRPAAGTIVAGELGKRLDTIVLDTAPSYWGAVLVAVDGKPVFAKGYGFADRQKIPNGPASLFDLGGATEQLTAIVTLRLCAEGKLRLDDPVAKHLHGWPADKAAITVGNLLHHTSGLSWSLGMWGSGAAAASRTAIDAIARTRLTGAPGTAAQHSPLDTILLALVVEDVLQARFDKIVTERMQKAFGMTGAGSCNGRFDGKLVTARRSQEDERGEPATAFALDWTHRGVGGVLASVLDVHALLGNLVAGKLLDEAQLDVLWRPSAGGEAFSVNVIGAGSERLVRVAGQTKGYRWRWLVHLATRTWIVLATEDFGSTAELETALLGELAQQLVAAQPPHEPPPAVPPPVPSSGAPGPGLPQSPVDGPSAERFVGTFAMPNGGGTLRIDRVGDGLRLSGSGLQASARIVDGAWSAGNAARAARAEDLGRALVERLARGDETAAEGFASPELASAAQRLIGDWLDAHGPLTRIEFVGTQFTGTQPHSWFLVHGADATMTFCAAWRDEQHLGSCRVPAEPPPFAVPLQVVRADCAIARAVAGGELRLTVEGPPSARVLVFEDGTPGPSGLLDCTLVGNAPR